MVSAWGRRPASTACLISDLALVKEDDSHLHLDRSEHLPLYLDELGLKHPVAFGNAGLLHYYELIPDCVLSIRF